MRSESRSQKATEQPCEAKERTRERPIPLSIFYLDSAFGEGFAKKHREIVAKFASIAASDFNASVIACPVQQVGDAIKSLKNESASLD